jgi:hypothetical protein
MVHTIITELTGIMEIIVILAAIVVDLMIVEMVEDVVKIILYQSVYLHEIMKTRTS